MSAPASVEPERSAPSRNLRGARFAPGGPGVLLLALVLSVVLLVASVASVVWWTRRSPAGAGWFTYGSGTGQPAPFTQDRPGMMGGSQAMGGLGMMGGRVWLAGDGVTVTSIPAARARAVEASTPQGLRPGEVMWFSNAFYVVLEDASGRPVTEVIVDPASGAVSTEPGPAMMWNTGSRSANVSEAQARGIAAAWLRTNRPGESVSSVLALPGYYTLDTQVAGRPVAMLSVNAVTGVVWYHTWHGGFIAEEEH